MHKLETNRKSSPRSQETSGEMIRVKNEAPKRRRSILKNPLGMELLPSHPVAPFDFSKVPENLRQLARSYADNLLGRYGPQYSLQQIASRLHAAVMAGEAGAKSALNCKTTDDGYFDDIEDSKNQILMTANLDACLHLGTPIEGEEKPSVKKEKGVRFEGTPTETSTPTAEKGTLMDYITQLLEEKMELKTARLPTCGTPGRLRGPRYEANLESDNEEFEDRRACEEHYPVLPGKRAFEEDEDEDELTVMTPKRRRMVDGVDNMKRKKIRRTRDVKSTHVMSEEHDDSDESECAAPVKRLYIPLRKGGSRCPARLFQAASEREEDI